MNKDNPMTPLEAKVREILDSYALGYMPSYTGKNVMDKEEATTSILALIDGESKAINKLKFLLTGSVKSNERRRRWIEKAHHLDGCTYSDNGYLKSSKCSCKKLELEKSWAEKQDKYTAIRSSGEGK